MANDDRNRPIDPRSDPRDDSARVEPTRDDEGWRRSSPNRPPYTGRDEDLRELEDMEDAEARAGTAESIAAGRRHSGGTVAGRKGSLSYDPPKVDESIEVDVPVSVAYNQWTQFEDFPKFMDGVESVQQLDDKRLRWVAEIGGKRKEWTAEISEQQPDRCIAWHSTSGARNAGRVDFTPVGANRCRINLVLDYEPETTLESAADFLGIVAGRVKGDLERFKNFIESAGSETGAWRGRIHGGREE